MYRAHHFAQLLRKLAANGKSSVQHRQCNFQVVDTLLDYVTKVNFATAK